MNPLQLVPAKARATIYIFALIIGVVVPILVPEVSPTLRLVLTVLGSSAALFSSTSGLSNLTPDTENFAIQERVKQEDQVESDIYQTYSPALLTQPNQSS